MNPIKELIEAVREWSIVRKQPYYGEEPCPQCVAEDKIIAALAAAEEYMKARPAPAQDDVSWRRVGMLEGLLDGITLRSDVPQDVKNKIKAALRREEE